MRESRILLFPFARHRRTKWHPPGHSGNVWQAWGMNPSLWSSTLTRRATLLWVQQPDPQPKAILDLLVDMLPSPIIAGYARKTRSWARSTPGPFSCWWMKTAWWTWMTKPVLSDINQSVRCLCVCLSPHLAAPTSLSLSTPKTLFNSGGLAPGKMPH